MTLFGFSQNKQGGYAKNTKHGDIGIHNVRNIMMKKVTRDEFSEIMDGYYDRDKAKSKKNH